MEANQDAIHIWSLVCWQRIYAGMDGLSIDMDHLAVWKAIEKYRVESPTTCFEKILDIYQRISDIEQSEREQRRIMQR